MAEEAQQRVETAVSNFVDDIERDHLRRMQRSMHLCAADCCSDVKSSMNSVHACVEHCARDLNKAQNFVQNELGQFQERLQRGVLLCQDKIKEKAPDVVPDAGFAPSKPKGFSTLSTLSNSKGKQSGIVDLSESEDIMTFNEDDDIERIANFSLYATQLQSVQSSSRSLGITANLPRIEPFMHWGVIVEFEPDRAVYTFDADTTGPLTGGDFVVKTLKGYPKGVQSLRKVGSIQMSPKELIHRARKVTSSHGKYEFVFSNCQSWANQFCREISPTFAGELPTTVGEITTWVAATGAAVVSIAFAGWGLIKALQYRTQNKRDGSEDKRTH